MSNVTNFHVIKDPVHGTMQFSTIENAWLKPFIDSPHFQRLRHIKQLGMGDFIFPGAVHTRFNHCLGCSYIAGQIAHKIGLAEEERQLVMLACLLHDIGHGPFSHTFEDVFYQKAIRHEAWTPYFLQDYRTEPFFDAYQKTNPRYPLTVEKCSTIEAMIMHKTPIKRLLADIVSSQLDADRLDYLLRDSHFCGVTYGEFDFQWMVNSMIIAETNEGERLGLTHKGIGVIEHYLMARRLMTRNIYFHPKKLALEFYLVQLLAHLAIDLTTESAFKPLKETRLGLFLLEVNQFNTEAKKSTQIEALKTTFLQKNYPLYRELCDYDVFSLIKTLANLDGDHLVIALAKRLHLRIMPKILRLDQVDLEKVTALLNHFKAQTPTIADWQFALIKTPHRSYSIEEDPILILNENGLIKPLNETSLMIHSIGDKDEHCAFLCIDKMIYNDPKIQKMIKKLIQKIE